MDTGFFHAKINRMRMIKIIFPDELYHHRAFWSSLILHIKKILYGKE